jgi:hypothetical protein
MNRSFIQLPCMAFSMTKIPSISSIFEKEDELNYTDYALQLQYILRYSIILNSECPENSTDFNQFSVWGITDWLIKNYPKFRDEFQGSNLMPDRKIQA